jgi:hypothetical protein
VFEEHVNTWCSQYSVSYEDEKELIERTKALAQSDAREDRAFFSAKPLTDCQGVIRAAILIDMASGGRVELASFDSSTQDAKEVYEKLYRDAKPTLSNERNLPRLVEMFRQIDRILGVNRDEGAQPPTPESAVQKQPLREDRGDDGSRVGGSDPSLEGEPANVATPPIDTTELAILKTLEHMNGVALTNLEIINELKHTAPNVPQGESKVKASVSRLVEIGLANRPEGQSRGVVISEDGAKRVKKLKSSQTHP